MLGTFAEIGDSGRKTANYKIKYDHKEYSFRQGINIKWLQKTFPLQTLE